MELSGMTQEGKAKGSLGVGVIGAGIVARGYLEFFSRNARTRLVGLAESDPVTRQRAVEQYAPRQAGEDYRDLLGCDDIDLFVVCTSHNLHCPMVMAVLRAGKHVLCEKPIAVSVTEADAMLDCATVQRRRLFIGLNMRFSRRVMKLRQLLDNVGGWTVGSRLRGVAGRVFLAQFAYLGNEIARMSDPNGWKCDQMRAGHGVLLDGGYHIIDVLNACFGRALSVQATGGRKIIDVSTKGEDNAIALIEYESGSAAGR